MNIAKAVFSALTVIFALLGVTNILDYDFSLPMMFICLGLAMLMNAKEHYAKGEKMMGHLFAFISIFIYTKTLYNVLSRIF